VADVVTANNRMSRGQTTRPYGAAVGVEGAGQSREQAPDRSGRGPEISIRDLSVRFGDESTGVAALQSINLAIRHHEFVAIMGPSGCGKTTLLNIIAGFLAPTSGEAWIGSELIARPGPDRAVVFQDDAVFPWMTVEENIAFSPRARGKKRAEIAAIVDRYVSLVGLDDFRKAWPSQLSGGMRKRVDLARGYAANPKVLLLDEPFGALDIMTKERLQEEFHNLWLTEPRTVVLVTHDLEEALYLGDRVVVMTPRPGRIAKVYEPRFPKPRDQSIRTSSEFVAYRREIRELIADVGRSGGAGADE
jgi:NitT/TauT family transport system ATP-binding protein